MDWIITSSSITKWFCFISCHIYPNVTILTYALRLILANHSMFLYGKLYEWSLHPLHHWTVIDLNYEKYFDVNKPSPLKCECVLREGERIALLTIAKCHISAPTLGDNRDQTLKSISHSIITLKTLFMFRSYLKCIFAIHIDHTHSCLVSWWDFVLLSWRYAVVLTGVTISGAENIVRTEIKLGSFSELFSSRLTISLIVCTCQHNFACFLFTNDVLIGFIRNRFVSHLARTEWEIYGTVGFGDKTHSTNCIEVVGVFVGVLCTKRSQSSILKSH